jgi:hypothetical protein
LRIQNIVLHLPINQSHIFYLLTHFLIMATKQTNTETTFYKYLLGHCQKQYNDIQKITRVYITDKKVFAIDYIKTDGTNSFASNTFDADIVVIVK